MATTKSGEKNRSHSCSTSPRQKSDGLEDGEAVQWSSNAELRSEAAGDGDNAHGGGTNGAGSLLKPTTLDLKHKFSSYCRPKQDLSRDEEAKINKRVGIIVVAETPAEGLSEGALNESFASFEHADDNDDHNDDDQAERNADPHDGEWVDTPHYDPFAALASSPDCGAVLPSIYFECSVHRYSGSFSIGFRRCTMGQNQVILRH